MISRDCFSINYEDLKKSDLSKTLKIGKFLDFVAKFRILVFLIFCVKCLDKTSVIRVLLNRLCIEKTCFFESKCEDLDFKFILNKGKGFGIISPKFFEPRVYRFMTAVVGDLFIDIGANVGGYSILNYRRFKKVIAVEPGATQFRMLKDNIKLNQITTIETLNNAICTKEGLIKLYKSANLVNYSIVHHNQEYEIVNSTTLDNLLLNFEYVDLLKIDVEGAELEVIRSGLDQIRKVYLIIIEVRKLYFNIINQLLEKAGFRHIILEERVSGERNVLFVNENKNLTFASPISFKRHKP